MLHSMSSPPSPPRKPRRRGRPTTNRTHIVRLNNNDMNKNGGMNKESRDLLAGHKNAIKQIDFPKSAYTKSGMIRKLVENQLWNIFNRNTLQLTYSFKI